MVKTKQNKQQMKTFREIFNKQCGFSCDDETVRVQTYLSNIEKAAEIYVSQFKPSSSPLENKTAEDHIGSVTKCPTCSSRVKVMAEGETHYYLPSTNTVEIADDEIQRQLLLISDQRTNRRRNWGKGQTVGMPPTSKEDNAYLDGFEECAKWYRSELARRKGGKGE